MTRKKFLTIWKEEVNDLSDAYNLLDQILDEYKSELEAKDKEIERLKEFEKMVEWMEQNSNSSLCDYYNSEGQ